MIPDELAGLAGAQVSISYSALSKMQRQIEEQGLEIERLKNEVTRAERGAEGSATHALGEAFDRAFVIVRFAVANLPPEQNPGWPHDELAWLAEHIETLPGKKGAQDLAITLRERARVMKKYADAFKEGRLRELVQEENLNKNSGRSLMGSAVMPEGLRHAPDGDEAVAVPAVPAVTEEGGEF